MAASSGISGSPKFARHAVTISPNTCSYIRAPAEPLKQLLKPWCQRAPLTDSPRSGRITLAKQQPGRFLSATGPGRGLLGGLLPAGRDLPCDSSFFLRASKRSI